ncbi:TVP38/TMEM64 family protein [Streptococcus hillyeri]|uniref:TVP38/TMEM64 family membrane protein n=1 Tax=Streptococcus hillyeri TaxID=2282420 RepID=A0A3L9DRP2_9STRE|nr:VTT domain-containing protein [Streptococcus hillyeri]RLY01802.1 TVP38/TMEM64 family protein [Streptococcus hillyeri]
MSKEINPKRYQIYQKIVKIVGVLALVLSVVLVAYLIRGLKVFENPDALAELIKDHMIFGSISFFLIQVIQVIVPIIPGGVTTVIGFMAFEFWWGLFLNYVSLSLGSLILFWLVKEYGRPFILLFVDEKHLIKYEKHLSSKTYERFFILNMLSPMAPADVMVMVTGLSSMSYRKFIRIILICKPISIVTYSYFWIYGGQWLEKLF